MCHAVISHSVMSESLQPHGLQPARLLSPWGFSRQKYWNGLPFPPPGIYRTRDGDKKSQELRCLCQYSLKEEEEKPSQEKTEGQFKVQL